LRVRIRGTFRNRRHLVALALLCATCLSGWASASARQDDPDESLRQDRIVGAIERTCRRVVTESREGDPASPAPVPDMTRQALDADAYCGCATKRMRQALATGRIDPADRDALDRESGVIFNACALDGLIDNFQPFCGALFTHFYGEDVLKGPFSGEISRFCDCTRAGLHQLRPDALDASMQRAEENAEKYRESGVLENRRDGSLASIMAGCGMVDLKRRLIESSMH
jgi:hypothetical protein